jgi:hypothetical protein
MTTRARRIVALAVPIGLCVLGHIGFAIERERFRTRMADVVSRLEPELRADGMSPRQVRTIAGSFNSVERDIAWYIDGQGRIVLYLITALGAGFAWLLLSRPRPPSA